MTTLYGSTVVNGILVPNFTQSAIYPSQAPVPQYLGGRVNPPPTIPGGLSAGPQGLGGIGGGGDPTANATINAASQPWNPKASPVLWAVGGLLVGIIGLRHIHFRGIDGG